MRPTQCRTLCYGRRRRRRRRQQRRRCCHCHPPSSRLHGSLNCVLALLISRRANCILTRLWLCVCARSLASECACEHAASEYRWRRSINVYTKFFASSIYLCLSLFLFFHLRAFKYRIRRKKCYSVRSVLPSTAGTACFRACERQPTHARTTYCSVLSLYISFHHNSSHSRYLHLVHVSDVDRHSKLCTMNLSRYEMSKQNNEK